MLNGRKHWTSLDGIRGLWYENEHNAWAFGLSSDRGSGVVSIHSVHDSGCPIQNGMRYKHVNNSSWVLAPKKSVSLTCSGGLYSKDSSWSKVLINVVLTIVIINT